MTSRRPSWVHVERRIPEWWNDGLTDENFGFVDSWEGDGRHPGLGAMPTVLSDIQADLDLGFVPKEALYRGVTGQNLDGNPVDRREDMALLQHYLDARGQVARGMSGLPSIAPKEMKDYYRSYINGLLDAMDNQFRDSFYGRTSVTGGRTWIGADTLGGLNDLSREKSKASLNGANLQAYHDGFARAVRDYQEKIRRGYTRRAVPGWQDPRQPDALSPLEIPLHMLHEDLYPDDSQ